MYKDKAILNAIQEMPKGRRSCCSIAAAAAGSLALFATPPIREIILSPLSIYLISTEWTTFHGLFLPLTLPTCLICYHRRLLRQLLQQGVATTALTG